MGDVLPYIYLAYMFISLYMLSLFLLIYFFNRKSFFTFPSPKEIPPLSVLIPSWNEEKTLAETVRHVLNIGYPKIKEIIIINDASTDHTLQVARLLEKKYLLVKVLDNKKNLGKAGSLNRAIQISTGELIAVIDADSYPAKNSINKMIGFFNDSNVGAVTCPVTARNPKTFFEKLQAIEYKVIAFSRKLLDYVDSIYVTPGPLAIYRREALEEIGSFDENNLTEDIEATWNLTSKGWERRMCLATEVTTSVPRTIKSWFVQRKRWNLGGLQCIYKYRKFLLNSRGGMLGWFIIPFFIANAFLGLVGLSIFFYLFLKRIISAFLLTKYSLDAGTPLLTLNQIYITPSVLNYFGIILFLAGLIFTLVVLSILHEQILRKENILNIPFYMTIYLVIYPFIMVSAVWALLRKKRVWR